MINYDLDQAALACGIDPAEGVIVAYLPKLEAVMQEHAAEFGSILYSLDGVAIDMLPSSKWWKVKTAARIHNLAILEPIWAGPAADMRVSQLPDLPPTYPGWKLHMRAFSHGPWICIDKENMDKMRDANSV